MKTIQEQMNKVRTEQLNQVVSEMKHYFDNWDESIRNHKQPVTIQDLDYWICIIKCYLRDVKQ